MLRDKIFKKLDEHFIKEMFMDSVIQKEDERHYNDNYLHIIFVWLENSILRILIRNWKTNKSFSKNIKIDFEISKETLVSIIKETVFQNSGIESRDLLNDWYEIKKDEIRDKKISSLGI